MECNLGEDSQPVLLPVYILLETRRVISESQILSNFLHHGNYYYFLLLSVYVFGIIDEHERGLI